MSDCIPEEKKDNEREVWEFTTPLAWHNSSVAAKDSIFEEAYKATRHQIEETARICGYDEILEVGCGTGNVIGEMKNTTIPRFGLNIKEGFIKFCDEHHSHDHMREFHVADALPWSGGSPKDWIKCSPNPL
jgi:ubiquinone/menaquinone biosynthesis C-methylase UbiE